MNLEFLNVIRAKLYSVQGHWLLYDFLSWRQMSDGRVSWSQKMSDKSRFFMQIFSTWVNVSTRKFQRENPRQQLNSQESWIFDRIGKKKSSILHQNLPKQHHFWNRKKSWGFGILKNFSVGNPTCNFFFQNWCCTVFENHRKSLIQYCERSELRFHFVCGQTVLPDRSLLMVQKLLENTKKHQNSNAIVWVNFQKNVVQVT